MQRRRRWGVFIMAGIAWATWAYGLPPTLPMSDWPGTVFTAGPPQPQPIVAGYPFSYFPWSNGAVSFSATGLPPGLTIEPNYGHISGTPQSAGSYPITVTATNADGSTSRNVTLQVDPAPTEAPTMPQLVDRSTTFTGSNPPTLASDEKAYGGGVYFLLNATNYPRKYTATNLPPGVVLDQAGLIWYEPVLVGTGRYDVTITATNDIGSASTSFHWDVYPALEQLTPSKTAYAFGDTLTITAKFSGNVVVTGTPYVPVRSGTRQATYVSGGGTNTLTFSYQTTAADGDFTENVADHIELNGGTIVSPDSLAVGVTMPAPASGSWTPSYTVSGSETAPPILRPLTNQEAFHYTSFGEGFHELKTTATNSPTSWSETGMPPGMQFSTTDGTFLWSGDNLSGGEYDVTLTATNSAGSGSTTFRWIVHPGLTDFIQTDKHTYGPGEIITFTASFSAPVVVSGSPYVSWGGSAKAMYASGSGTTKLTFTYMVPADAAASAGNTVWGITLDGGTIGTPGGTAATLAIPDAPGIVPPAFDIVAGSNALATQPPASGSTTPPPSSTPPSTQPPPSPTPPVATTPSPTTPPPVAAKSDQAITFSSPVGAIVVGQPITLGAISSAGLPITYTVISGDATIAGNTLTPLSAATLIVRASSTGSDSVNAASTDVNFGAPRKATQSIALGSAGGDVVADTPIALSATSSAGLPVSYSVASGPASITGNTLSFTGTGSVTVRVSQAGSDSVAAAPDATLTFTAHPVSRLINVSSRLHVSSGETAIVGFVVTGTSPKRILVRAVGDSLASLGVSDPLANPRLTLFDSAGTSIVSNSGWSGDAQIAAADSATGAFALAPGGSDAAVLATLAPGAYTAHVTAPGVGTVLLEVYDVSANDPVPTKQLINVSTRAHIDAASSIVEGFVVAGDHPKRVLIRAVGATLGQFGVAGAAPNPSLQVYSSSLVIAQNDDWGTPEPVLQAAAPGTSAAIAAASTSVGAFALPDGSKDAAVLLTLSPGAYTVVVNGSTTQSGEVLVETYEVP